MKFSPALLDDIRARLPVSTVVGRKVALKKSGREWRGLSPFKTEKSPSFFVNDHKGFYHCFASGEHGDIFTFLMKVEGLSFPEAVERCAEEAGIPLPKEPPRSPEAQRQMEERDDERTRLHKLLAEAQTFFEAQLHASSGAEARRYIVMKRGLRPETIKDFRIGFAPAGRTQLKDHLTAKGFTIPDMIASGMLIGGDDIPVPYDRFRNRVMFPITDLKDRVIAFGGRALDPDAPAKYLNSPETPLFHKGHVLFNAARARQTAHTKNRVIAVEGYMDVVALSEAGFTESVAPLGTALTEDQVKLLWRMADEPILCFDGDTAGQKAAFRAVDTVLPHLKPGSSVRFAFLPDGLDPDDLIRQSGADAMEDCLTKTKSLVDMLWEREWSSGDWTTPERRAQLEKQLRELVMRITDPAVKNHYGQDIRDRLFHAWSRNHRQNNPRPGNTPQGGSYYASASPQGGNRRPQQGFNGQRSNGQGGKRFGAPGQNGFNPFPPIPTESLKNSRIVTGDATAPPQREALLTLTLVNHPWLMDELSEDIANLDFTHRGLATFRDTLLGILANTDSAAPPLDSAAIRAQVHNLGFDKLLALIERTVTLRSDKFASPEADRHAVEAGWRHTQLMHQRDVGLQRALEAAVAIHDADQTDANFARIAEIKALMTKRVDLEDAS